MPTFDVLSADLNEFTKLHSTYVNKGHTVHSQPFKSGLGTLYGSLIPHPL